MHKIFCQKIQNLKNFIYDFLKVHSWFFLDNYYLYSTLYYLLYFLLISIFFSLSLSLILVFYLYITYYIIHYIHIMHVHYFQLSVTHAHAHTTNFIPNIHYFAKNCICIIIQLSLCYISVTSWYVSNGRKKRLIEIWHY